MKNAESRKPKKLVWLWLCVLMIFLFFSIVTFLVMPTKNVYTVSPETTVAIGPLDTDGYVDNMAVVNENLRGKITPESNANVIIWQAIGPHPDGETMPEEYFQFLGRPAPPEDGEYFISFRNFMTSRLPLGTLESEKKDAENLATDQITQSRKWPWKAEDIGELAACLARNSKAIDLLTKASQLPDYYNPLAVSSARPRDQWLMHCKLTNTSSCRNAADLICARAMLRLGEGKFDEAWADLMTCHRLGRLLQRGGSLVEQLVGIAIESIAIQGEQVYLSQAKMTKMRIGVCRDDLRKLPAIPSVADHLDFTERFAILDLIQQFARKGPDFLKTLGFDSMEGLGLSSTTLIARSTDWNSAMKYANAWCDRYVASLRLEDPTERREKVAACDAELKQMANEVKTQALAAPLLGAQQRGTLFGKFIVMLTMTIVSKVSNAEESLRQRNDNLIVSIELESYRLDHGQYPANLLDLQPKYLESISNDRFSSGNLIYLPKETGYLLYSVGPNRKDELGKGRDDHPTGDDITVEMPALEPIPKSR